MRTKTKKTTVTTGLWQGVHNSYCQLLWAHMIHDFSTLFFVILRCESSEWFESSIESDLGVRFAIISLCLVFHNFAFFKHSVTELLRDIILVVTYRLIA